MNYLYHSFSPTPIHMLIPSTTTIATATPFTRNWNGAGAVFAASPVQDVYQLAFRLLEIPFRMVVPWIFDLDRGGKNDRPNVTIYKLWFIIGEFFFNDILLLCGKWCDDSCSYWIWMSKGELILRNSTLGSLGILRKAPRKEGAQAQVACTPGCGGQIPSLKTNSWLWKLMFGRCKFPIEIVPFLPTFVRFLGCKVVDKLKKPACGLMAFLV